MRKYWFGVGLDRHLEAVLYSREDRHEQVFYYIFDSRECLMNGLCLTDFVLVSGDWRACCAQFAPPYFGSLAPSSRIATVLSSVNFHATGSLFSPICILLLVLSPVARFLHYLAYIG
jgi:hypothetical protein